jgi:hypothetical protein
MEVVRRQMLTSSVYEKKVDFKGRRTKGYLFREVSDWRCRNLDFEGGKLFVHARERFCTRAMAVLVCLEEIWANPRRPPSFLGRCHLKVEPRT